jgi:hypothetical protein
VPEPKCRAQTSTTAANHDAISIFRLLGLAAGVPLALPVAHGIGRLYRAKRTRRPALARRAYTVYYTARGQGTQHFAATLFSALIRARSNNSPQLPRAGGPAARARTTSFSSVQARRIPVVADGCRLCSTC